MEFQLYAKEKKSTKKNCINSNKNIVNKLSEMKYLSNLRKRNQKRF